MAQKKFDLVQKLRTFNRPSIFQFILMGLGLVLAVGVMDFPDRFCVLLAGDLAAGHSPADLFHQQARAAAATNPGDTPVAQTATPTVSAPQIQLPPAWDGASRVTVLIVGLRGGADNQDCPLCTDTMILLTIDPVSKTAGMLSIPRDMWVNIPGFRLREDQFCLYPGRII